MPSPPPTPLAVDLNVMKLGTAEDPVSRDDVWRALYALTGWEQPQPLLDQAMRVVDAYAGHGVVSDGRAGHLVVQRGETCQREHLDEHQCPVIVKTEEFPRSEYCQGGCSRVADELTALIPYVEPPSLAETTPYVEPCAAPAGCVVREGCPRGCQVAKFEASEAQRRVEDATLETVPARRLTMTPEELLVADEATLTVQQRRARDVLASGRQVCVRCGTDKPLTAYYKDRSRLTGRMSRCSDCAKVIAATRRG